MGFPTAFIEIQAMLGVINACILSARKCATIYSNMQYRGSLNICGLNLFPNAYIVHMLWNVWEGVPRGIIMYIFRYIYINWYMFDDMVFIGMITILESPIWINQANVPNQIFACIFIYIYILKNRWVRCQNRLFIEEFIYTDLQKYNFACISRDHSSSI